MIAAGAGEAGSQSRGSRGRGAWAATAVVAALAVAGCTAEIGGDPGAEPSTSGGSAAASADADARAEALASESNRYAGNRPPPLVSQLEEASAGLLFMSESDYPFEVIYWTHPGGVPTAERVAALTGHVGEEWEERTLDAFFLGATTPQDGQTADELEAVRRYQALVRLLRKKLSFVRVYRFGRIQIHSYVVGVTTSGAWAGLSTIQIET